METKARMKALLKFYRNKLKNKYYVNKAEKIRLEERVKHYEKLLND